jgi:glycosyltransferase involved in cell wall biosynthesis
VHKWGKYTILNIYNIHNYKMKKIAYIDHSFHKKTGSADFFRDILKRHFIVMDFWDNSRQGGKSVTTSEINKLSPEIVIYFQSIGKISEIKKIKSKNIILIPMEDGFFYKKIEWLNYKKLNLKILCFSRNIFEKVSQLGLSALRVQYFIKPQKQQKDFSKLRVYFWQRRRSINWNVVKKLLGGQHIDKLIFRNIPDPFMIKMPIPSKREMERYHIEISDKWLERSEMDKILSDFNVFIAPRKYEGIGMAFLEAMSYGMAVIAPDTLTHNEYIKSGFNGYLYDLKSPKPIDFSDIENISNNAFRTVNEGYARWQKSENEIVNFIDKISETASLSRKENVLIISANIFYNPLIQAKRSIKNVIKRILNQLLNGKQK